MLWSWPDARPFEQSRRTVLGGWAAGTDDGIRTTGRIEMERWWQPAAYYCSTIPADRLSSIPLFPVHAVGREQGGARFSFTRRGSGANGNDCPAIFRHVCLRRRQRSRRSFWGETLSQLLETSVFCFSTAGIFKFHSILKWRTALETRPTVHGSDLDLSRRIDSVDVCAQVIELSLAVWSHLPSPLYVPSVCPFSIPPALAPIASQSTIIKSGRCCPSTIHQLLCMF